LFALNHIHCDEFSTGQQFQQFILGVSITIAQDQGDHANQ
jgi:hypothetical protein